MSQSATANRASRQLARPLKRRGRLQNKRSFALRALRFESLEHRLLLATVTLTTSKDNTLIESPAGNSNGAHQIYAGKVGSRGSDSIRRGLMAFDLSGIAPGSTVTAASLDLIVSRSAAPGNQDTSLHKMMADWGEGGSFKTGCRVDDCGGEGGTARTNDATWTLRFFPGMPWTNPGGDFVATESATESVGAAGTIANWSSPGMVADIQSWVNDAATNFGWLLRGNETSARSVKRFASKDLGPTPPQLTVTFSEPVNLTLVIAADSISEGDGAGATTATVSRSGDTSSALTVNLSSSDTTEATVQTTVAIAAGQTTSPPFSIDAVDDTVVDGPQTVTITASTGGSSSTDTVVVTDDDVAGGTVIGHSVNGGSANRSGLATFMLQFDRNVSINSASSLKLRNETTGSVIDTTGVNYVGSGSDQVTWNFSGVELPDGFYTAKLPITEGTLAATHTDLFSLAAGDSDGDGAVGFGDFGELAAAFNTAGGAVYGPGDMDGDGSVGFTDFGILAANFNNSLTPLTLDFGDAPSPFPTLLVDGARHVIGSGLTLGATVDGETDGQPDAAANGDGGDEDGVTFGTLQAGSNAAITVSAVVPTTAVLNAWIDFNKNGDWSDPGEQIFVDEPISNGTNSLSAGIPAGTTAGQAFARFRISSCTGHSYVGLARDGEVEDYQVALVAAKQSSSRPALASLWAAPFAAQPSTASTLSVASHTDRGESVANRVEVMPPEVVDLAIAEVAMTELRPQGITGTPPRWDEDVSPLLEEADLLSDATK